MIYLLRSTEGRRRPLPGRRLSWGRLHRSGPRRRPRRRRAPPGRRLPWGRLDRSDDRATRPRLTRDENATPRRLSPLQDADSTQAKGKSRVSLKGAGIEAGPFLKIDTIRGDSGRKLGVGRNRCRAARRALPSRGRTPGGATSNRDDGHCGYTRARGRRYEEGKD